ncbi:hypothetical protein ACMD2_15177 [Ananas comosus]|uniref:Uncharacterized protein n=1 Tax=Ananas comosus TaxID=4615 RepID=A0A199VH68_ANACO|nr:hypothetical protein ACMD2_15177 [Ananas comosus]
MAKPLSLGPLGAPNFQSVLKESIDRFLVEIQKRDSCDFSPFRLIFFRLLQSSSDPPLEIVWFYSAVGYHEAIAGKRDDPLGRVAAVKDLLQMLAACSASCGGAKCLALLAPRFRAVLLRLAAAKLPKKERRGSKSSGGGDSTPSCLLRFRRSCSRVTVHHANNKGALGVLFPLVSDETRVWDWLLSCGCGGRGILAEVVLEGTRRWFSEAELQKELRFGLLARSPCSRTASSLSTEEEILVRDILYDALILVDYSFVNPGVEVEQADESTISILITRLIVAYEATEIARRRGSGKSLVIYKCLLNFEHSIYLTKWVGSQVGSEKPNRPNSTAPQALLKWLVDLKTRDLDCSGTTFLDFARAKKQTPISLFDKQRNDTEEDHKDRTSKWWIMLLWLR